LYYSRMLFLFLESKKCNSDLLSACHREQQMNSTWYVILAAEFVGTAAILCVPVTHVYSQQIENFALVGAAAQSCAQFGELYKKSPADAEVIFFTWAQGMTSGLNMSLPSRNSPESGLVLSDNERQMEYIRAYCFNSPLAFYGQAVLDLYDAMRREQGLPDWRR